MKHASLLVSLLLFLSATAFAQSAASQRGSMNWQQQTIQGCLAGSPGQYRLTEDNGTVHLLMGDPKDLSAHVGQEVQLAGKRDVNRDASASSDQGIARGQRFFRVDSVRGLQSSCRK